ncbi:MAG: class I SAM-dependent methyltransferase [Acidobacteria bacterium]|nr:class I SAM-dependent methyltransferase [Acidobacteriota bacterium]
MFGGRFRKWFFARCLLPGASGRHERLVEGRKRGLFAVLGPGQTVVELGPGTGPNFAYFPASIRWLGVEPNPYLRQRLLTGQSREVFESTKDVPSGTADAVVSTLVLCSVEDPGAMLREVRRMLKPGGVFLFLEHVAAPEGCARRRTQKRVRRVWRWFGDGCDVCRETADELARAGFSAVEWQAFEVNELGPAAPHIVGRALN